MARFVLNPGLSVVFLPGFGKVSRGEPLVGEGYRRFCPVFLTEIAEPQPQTVVVVLAPEPTTLPPPVAAVSPVVELTPVPVPEPEPVSAPVAVPAPIDSVPAPVDATAAQEGKPRRRPRR